MMPLISVPWDRPPVRLLVSVLIVGHLLAVITAPLGFQTQSGRGTSPSVETLAWPVHGYGEFLYLNRGYAFFAPDPGPSHLFQASITTPGDTPTPSEDPVFPDLQVHWPRLLYHRHFMLAEFLTEIYQAPGPPAELQELDAGAAELWRLLRARYERVRQSFALHLESLHPDHDVALRRLEHLIPGFLEFHDQSLNLKDESLYRVMLDQVPPEDGSLLPEGNLEETQQAIDPAGVPSLEGGSKSDETIPQVDREGNRP